jgi:hypothetical protein
MKQALNLAIVVALGAFPFASSSAAAAQEALQFPQASPPAMVRNTVGLTTVEIEYARPSVKGRKVFGGLLAYGEVWRTGANAATKITFSTDVTFGGKAVSAGTYALFTIPGEKEWAVILNEGVGQWGTYAYDEKKDVVRVIVKPTTLRAPVETLTLDVGHLRTDSGMLSLAWETTHVAVEIKTDLVALLVPKIEAAMAGEGDQKPYLQAAMFYYEHDLDLIKARDWINAGEAQQPEAVWVVYRKGLILQKLGDIETALEAAKRASGLAKKVGGALGAEYGRLSSSLIASLNEAM